MSAALDFWCRQQWQRLGRALARARTPAQAQKIAAELGDLLREQDTRRATVAGDPARCSPCLRGDSNWRQARLALRQAGHEVKQFDGVLYVDGYVADRLANPELFP